MFATLRLWCTLACIPLGAGAACAGQQKPVERRSSLIAAGNTAQRFESPARWHYHPREPASLTARLSLPSKSVLFAGERGERWLYDSERKQLSAASHLASESLIAILPLSGERWLFVGQSGTGYEAKSPLGPFVRSSPPVDPLTQVSAEGSSVVGIRFDGALIQTTDAGQSWSRVPHPGQFFVDVELGPAGTGIALSIPEAWYATKDHGQTWARVDVPTVGALGLGRDPKAGIVALGATSWYDVDPRSKSVFEPRSSGPVDQGYKLTVKPPRGPDAAALAEHRALFLGAQYVEVVRHDERPDGWALLFGALGQPLTMRPLPLSGKCEAVRLAGFGTTIYLACFKAEPDDVAVPMDLYLSNDSGKSFKREAFTLRAKLAEFAMAVGADARLVLSGICSPQDSSRGCAPHGVYHKRDEQAVGEAGSSSGVSSSQPKQALALSAVPGLARPPMAMIYSVDGRVAYLVGQRTKSDNYTMFVSSDQGETFQAREIEQLTARPPRSSSETRWYQRRKASDAVLDMQAAEDGTLSVVIQRGDGLALAVTDDDGRVLSLTPGPGESTTLGAYGTRAVAFAADTGKAWETLDGGVSWQTIGSLPVELCEKTQECDVQIRCGVAGCVIGEKLTRIGWRGQARADQTLPGPPQSLSTGLLYPRVRTPLSCTLADNEWSLLLGVSEPPSAHEAAIGNTAWHIHGSDPDTAAAWAYHGKRGRRQEVTQAVLFAPAQQPEQVAFALFDQIEGAAAIRYRIPRAGERGMVGLELAWDNRFEDVVKHASLDRRLALQSGDYVAQKSRTQLARPDLVSIGVGGVYLRPHHQAGDEQVTYFLDGRAVSEIPPLRWPDSPVSGRSEMVHADGEHLPVRLQARGAALTRARWSGGHWSFDSLTIGMPNPKDFDMVQQTGITYAGGRSAFYVVNFAASGQPRSAALFPVQASGPVAAPAGPVPVQLDLSDPPVACTEAQRTGTPRVVVPYQAGTRHPVLISHRIEPIRTLLSVDAVLHGTADAPCIAALAAVPVDMDDRDDRTWMYAVILPGELEHAWAFRVVYDEAGDKQVSYRSMRCEFDPKAVVPKKIFAEPGTLSSEP